MKQLSQIYLISSLILLLIMGCNGVKNTQSVPPEQIHSIKKSFLKDYWKWYPERAVRAGLYEYDGTLTVFDGFDRSVIRGFLYNYADSLDMLDPSLLDVYDKTDYLLLKNQIHSELWNLDTFKNWQWNAANYNIGPSIGQTLSGNHGNLEERMSIISQKLTNTASYYQVALENLQKPSKEHIIWAILQNEGTIETFKTKLMDSLNQLEGWEKSVETKNRIDSSIAVISGYIENLREIAENGETSSFRLGKEHYASKFKYDLSSAYSPDELYEIALTEKDEAITEILRLTQQLWPKYFDESLSSLNMQTVKKLIDRLSAEHVSPEDFMEAIDMQLDTLTAFVNNNNLITLDPDKPLKIREMPAYLQGISLVNIQSPGPFEKNTETFYNVNDLSKLPEEEAESWLREYNNYMIQILNIHEAIPGHYTQFMYANETSSLIKRLFGSNTMVEGWACYAERMMLDNGYGNDSPELWLMYYKWYLRIICNTIIDIRIHTGDMQKEEVIKLLTEEALQETAEAENKWLRAVRSQVQLCSYFSGLTEILDLKNEIAGLEEENFDLKDFHENFLSYGNSPVKHIRELMLSAYPVE